jgi:CxxC motif-containing protein (DUF1111 family)
MAMGSSRLLFHWIAVPSVLVVAAGCGKQPAEEVDIPEARPDASAFEDTDMRTSVDAVPDEPPTMNADAAVDTGGAGTADRDARPGAGVDGAGGWDAARPGDRPSISWLDDPNEIFSGGGATVFDTTRMAFSLSVPRLAPEREDEFFVGNAIFNRSWIIAPASVKEMDGLGPLYNATNCSGCHLRDGRGRPPETPGEEFLSMLMRLSVPGSSADMGPAPEPRYGGQLQGEAIPGVPREGRAKIRYEELAGRYADGETYSLRRPHYSIEELGYGPLAPDVLVSPRVANHLVGLGLLEAVPEADILARADPDDRDGDGLSGRPNYVWDRVADRRALGRFGWKANQPSLLQQTAGAFNGDMGITSALFPEESCTPAQAACAAAPRAEPGSDGPQLKKSFLRSVVAYVSTLAVPARRRADAPEVRAGKQVFDRLGCAGCHAPVMRTGVYMSIPELSNQRIRPFTDLLLHDMGPGLADGRPDFEASGSEWRTPPLWGLGLVPTVNRHRYLLHDGRARGFAEAILWHGGEAQASQDRFVKLPKGEREALVAFLESL